MSEKHWVGEDDIREIGGPKRPVLLAPESFFLGR